VDTKHTVHSRHIPLAVIDNIPTLHIATADMLLIVASTVAAFKLI
jgi:hypothetical protein